VTDGSTPKQGPSNNTRWQCSRRARWPQGPRRPSADAAASWQQAEEEEPAATDEHQWGRRQPPKLQGEKINKNILFYFIYFILF
jgi:hypothetical protein